MLNEMAEIAARPLAITPHGWRALVAKADHFLKYQQSAQTRADAADMAQPPGDTTTPGPCVVRIIGPIVKRDGILTYFNLAVSCQAIEKALTYAMGDTRASCIILQIDSPGGCVEGVPELADMVFNARKIKPVYSVADSMAASAAYWIGSQANKFFISPSGCAGSVGVIFVHFDCSKLYENEGIQPTIIYAGENKADLTEYAPLSDGARAAVQEDVNYFYKNFTAAVARGRGIKAREVELSYGGGRTLNAAAAVTAGAADGVMSFPAVVALAQKETAGKKSAMRAASVHEYKARAAQVAANALSLKQY
jgi:signal peptide peptidase SppA